MSNATVLRRPRRLFRLLTAIAVAALVAFRFLFYPGTTLPRLRLGGVDHDVFRVNSTLGFGSIYVVSAEGSPRRHNLLQAANITELEFTIPVQPKWAEDDLAKYSGLGKGSLLAWLGHLHSLRMFLESGAETALILEDDVDWDIRLRSLQVPLVTTAVRALISSESPGASPYPTSISGNPKAAAAQYPYGDPSRWDLLYLGHCGDYWHGMDVGFEDGHVQPKDLAHTQHVSFNDTSLAPFEDLHPWTASLLANLGVPAQTRLVHRSVFPLCTFAYAVTRDSARRMLDDLVSLDTGKHKAYDVAILIACRDKGLRCWTVNPELFHHMPGKSMIGGVENNKNTPPVDAEAREVVKLRNETANIDCGFWNGGFAYPDGDLNRLAYLQKEVGRKGRCLKEGRH